jgi:3-phenylpropionate/trans-cinnamate dioxygenase ferredoxin subunit/naphthalene 1,2-dioxygenase system ferredoxin subunit
VSADEDGWTDLIARAALEPGDVTPVEHGGRRLAIYDAPDGVHVTLARCTHGGADLCDGYFDGWIIECPLHQGAFDIRDGRALYAPATRPLKVFPARVRDGMVQAKL